MAEWKHHSHDWLVRQERMTPERWLVCFKRPPNYKGIGIPAFWVDVFAHEWREGEASNIIQAISCEEPAGELELECICHEMRKQYGAQHG